MIVDVSRDSIPKYFINQDSKVINESKIRGPRSRMDLRFGVL